MSLKGKRVVLLGGTSGIGLATARLAAGEGATVIVSSSRKDNVAVAVAALGSAADGHLVDLGKEEQVAALFSRIGDFDHLIYTAGESLQLGELAGTGMDAVRRAFELRFFGAMTAVKHASPHIRHGGSIVLTTGIASKRPQKAWTVAASICGAMDSLVRALAVELAPLRVNAVSPGFVRTPLWANIPEAQRAAMYAEVGAKLPVGRVGEAEDIAETYLYLMRNRFSTGQVVVVDGGGLLV